MKISIIVPVYNLEAYIEATLNSIIRQTCRDLEIIVVDDGSSDGTPEILDRYASLYPAVKVVRQRNEGVSAARLTGVKHAAGEFVGFVDGDDLIDPDMYERLLANALKYNADISHCGYRLVKEDAVEFFYNTGEFFVQNRFDGLIELLEGVRIEPSLCNKLFRRRLFDDLPRQMDLTVKNNEDLLMNYYLFSEAEVSVYEDFCPYQYIARRSSASKHTVDRNILADPVTVTRTILNALPKDKSLITVAARLYVIKLVKAATCYERTSDKEIVSVRKAAQKELRSFLPEYLSLKHESLKRRFLALSAACFPLGYYYLHQTYLKR